MLIADERALEMKTGDHRRLGKIIESAFHAIQRIRNSGGKKRLVSFFGKQAGKANHIGARSAHEINSVSTVNMQINKTGSEDNVGFRITGGQRGLLTGPFNCVRAKALLADRERD